MKILSTGEYYGSEKATSSFNGIILSEYDYLDPCTDWHFHENPYFMYVLNGNMYDINKNLKTNCQTGSFLFHNWQEPHYNTRETNYAKGFHIEFERKWFEQKKIDISLWEGSRLLEHPKFHHLLGKIYFEFKCRDAYSEVSIELLLLQLCEMTQTKRWASTKPPPWLPLLISIIHAQKEDLRLQSLSEELGVHPVHISRAFPKYMTSSLGDYVRQVKLKQAIGFLLGTKQSLTEIAYLCGFSDQSHFTRTFKVYLGKTPSAFRKLVQ